MRLLALLFLATFVSAETPSDLYDIQLKKVADGVYLAYRAEPLRPYVEGNVTIIVNEHDVVVVDAGGSPRAARNVIAHIRKLTPKPVRAVIFTHVHRDHRFGAQEYVKTFPGVELIAHPIVHGIVAGDPGTFVAGRIQRIENNRTELPKEIERLRAEGKPGNDKIIAMLQRYIDRDAATIVEEYKNIVNVAPTASFEGKMTLYRGARTIELLFLGRGDTDHDVVVHLPKEKVVVTGDMVVHPFPYGFSTQPDEWLATLRKLAALDFDQLIPGHGDVQRKPYLHRAIALVESVQTQVQAAVAAGLDLEATRKKVDLTSFENELAGDDPIARYYFQQYFVEPAVGEAFKKATAPR